MSTINKICLYAGKRYYPSSWKQCDGNDGMPKLNPIKVYEDDDYSAIPYYCCVNDDNYAEEPFMGQILTFVGDFAPHNWAPCDGRLLNIRDHSAVFALIGTTYGGNGMDNFALPKIPSIPNPKDPHGKPIQYIFCVSGMFPM